MKPGCDVITDPISGQISQSTGVVSTLGEPKKIHDPPDHGHHSDGVWVFDVAE